MCENQLSITQTHIIWIGTLVSGIFSLFGSSFMLLSFFTFGKGKGASSLIAILAFSDYGWAVTVITTFTILFIAPQWFNYDVCLTLRSLFQLFASSSVWWTTCISFFLYRSISTARKQNSWQMWAAFNVISWGIPLTFVTVLVSGGFIVQNPRLKLCYPIEPYHFLFWFVPNCMAFLFTLICFCLIQKNLKDRQSASASLWTTVYSLGNLTMPVHYRISLYLLVFLICWPLDIFTFAFNYYSPECHNFYLTFLYSVLLQAQGGLDAIVYGITNKQIREYYSGRGRRVSIVILLSPFLVIPSFFVWLRKSKTKKDELKPLLRPEEHHTTIDE